MVHCKKFKTKVGVGEQDGEFHNMQVIFYLWWTSLGVPLWPFTLLFPDPKMEAKHVMEDERKWKIKT